MRQLVVLLVITIVIVSALTVHSSLLVVDILARKREVSTLKAELHKINKESIEFHSNILDEIDKHQAVIFIINGSTK